MDRTGVGEDDVHRQLGRWAGQVVEGGDWRLRLGAVLMGLLSWVNFVLAAPGDLDPTFGSGGIAISFGPKDMVRAVVQLPDGKLVVAGSSSNQNFSMSYLLLVRYLADGRGDPLFDSGGKVTIPVGSHSAAAALALQPDGKLVMAGSAVLHIPMPVPPVSDMLLTRFLADGQLDTTFGRGGTATTTVQGNSPGSALLQ
jgi:uncharacterized delta-60 repeat protein